VLARRESTGESGTRCDRLALRADYCRIFSDYQPDRINFVHKHAPNGAKITGPPRSGLGVSESLREHVHWRKLSITGAA